MIKNKLKINDSKREFIVFRSPQAKQDLSSLSVSVGDGVITHSSKVRDLGVIFDQFLNFDDYISTVCRSTHFHLRNIGKIPHLMSYDACAQLIHALISRRAKLDQIQGGLQRAIQDSTRGGGCNNFFYFLRVKNRTF